MNKIILTDKKAPQILALGAHCDDIEIGCGGTLLKLLKEYPNAKVVWVVFSSNPERYVEAKHSAESYLKNHKDVTIEIKEFRNGFFPYVATEIKEYFETLKSLIEPDFVFTHFLHDRHQDHKTIAELTWNTFRNNMIFQYEIAKYEGDLTTPNFYATISEDFANIKVDSLHQYFPTQSSKHWFSKDLFYSMMRIRGIECASETKYAEGFHVQKTVY